MRHIFAAATIAVAALPAPAFASSVTAFGGMDAFNSYPTPRGETLLDSRLMTMAMQGSRHLTLAPTLNVALGVLDGLEVGVGTCMSYNGIGNDGARSSIELAYPWVRGGIGWTPHEALHFGYMVGGDVPVYQSNSEAAVGGLLLADAALGPVVVGANTGYKRYLGPSGLNALTGNLNFTYTMGKVMLMEENFVAFMPTGAQADAMAMAAAPAPGKGAPQPMDGMEGMAQRKVMATPGAMGAMSSTMNNPMGPMSGARVTLMFMPTKRFALDFSQSLVVSPSLAFMPNVGVTYLF